MFREFLKARLRSQGRHVRRHPRPLLDHPEAELLLTFDLFGPYLNEWIPDLFFVQIGANDGMSGDPLWPVVAKYHWRGLLVEPRPTAFAALKANYQNEPQLLFENVAVSEHSGVRILYVPPDSAPIGVNSVASFSREHVVRHGIERFGPIGEIQVECLPLKDLLARNHIDKVDLFQIDVEGYDAEVLRMIDFSRHRPAVIRYEHINLSPADQEASIRLLISHGYKIAIEGQWDTLACLPWK